MNLPLNQNQILRIVVVLLFLGYLWYLSSNGQLDLGALTAEPAEPLPTEVPGIAGNAGAFDFYVLALSWSPQFCSSNGANDPQQCGIGRRLGFVLHGLWPQDNTGYPTDCSSVKLTTAVKAQFANLYPSPNLFDHEWEKHGTCSGLQPADYLGLSERIKDSVVIPVAYRAPDQPIRATVDQLKNDFSNSNLGMAKDSLATFCTGSGRYFQELEICFSKDGKPRGCSSEILKSSSHSCQAADFLLRNVR
jgi:ribonuclease T2